MRRRAWHGPASGGRWPLATDKPSQGGDYLYLAGKEVHEFTCSSSCLLFDVIGGAFDIHYLNGAGQEITPEEALKPMAKAPAAKKP